jgi:hypothetical protein
MWRLHVDSIQRIANAVIPAMAAARDGRVVLHRQPYLRRQRPQRGQYTATKAALVALARSWAAEVVAAGVTVNVVSPAATETAMLADPLRAGEEAGPAAARAPHSARRGRLPSCSTYWAHRLVPSPARTSASAAARHVPGCDDADRKRLARCSQEPSRAKLCPPPPEREVMKKAKDKAGDAATVEAIRKSGARQGEGRGLGHRRDPARQVPAPRQVLLRGR